MTPSDPNAEQLTSAPPWQFGISSLLWLTVSVAMVLGYLRSLDAQVALSFLSLMVVALCAGLVIGPIRRRTIDGIYWALLGMLSTALCAVTFWREIGSMVLVWGYVGMAAGAMAGSWPPGGRVLKFIGCSLTGVGVMGIAVLMGHVMEPAIDIPCAALAGVILAIMSDVVTWLHGRYHTPREAWAAALIFAVIVGNLGAVWLMDAG